MTQTNDPAAIQGQQFRDAMAQVAAAVHVVTTAGPTGVWGVTATAFAAVSDTPPIVLVCLNRASRLNRLFKENGVFCVNTLGKGASALARAFSGEGDIAMAGRFALGSQGWGALASGAPYFKGALASFDCIVSEVREIGTHSVLFGKVADLHVGTRGQALIYHRRDYRAGIGPPAKQAGS
ncbi:MAG: flavin reductase family protein [Alphaproteobacteria bacterium]